MTLYRVNADPALLQSEMMTRGVLPCDVRRFIPFSQSAAMCSFRDLKCSSFSLDQSHCLVDLRVSFNFSINFLESADRQKVDWLTSPIKPLISLRFFGTGYLLMLSIWFSEGRTLD